MPQDKHSTHTASSRTLAAYDAVMSDADLVALILSMSALSPGAFVAFQRVCRVWRHACQTHEGLLLGAALGRPFMTKSDFMGLFALESWEADTYPHGKRARYPSGFMFMYGRDAALSVLGSIGGMQGWRRRLEQRKLKRRPAVYGRVAFENTAMTLC